MIIPAVVGLAAAAGAWAAGLGAYTIFGIGLPSIIGTVVSLGASLVMSSLTKPKSTGTGPSTTGLAEDRKQMIRGAVEPRQVIYGRARVSGAIVYAASSGPDLRYLHLVVVLAAHTCHDITTVWLNDTAIAPGDLDGGGMVTRPDHPMQGRVRLQKFLGGQAAAPPDLVAESPDGWTSADRLAGCTFLYLRLEYDPEKLPGLNSVSAEVWGKNDVWDPRSDAGGWTDNWALCVLDYLRGQHGLACDEDEMDLPSFVAAANMSDEAVTITDGISLTQPRYRCDGSFKLDRAPLDVMDDLLTAGGGALVYVAGRYRLHGGAYAIPSGAIGPTDFAGAVEVVPRVARADLFNGVRGTFIDPARNWEPSEFTAVSDPAFDAQDGGERVWRDIELPFTIDALRAHRLALMSLRRARQSLRIKAPMKFGSLRFCVWQTVTVTLPDLGLETRPMRIIGWEYEPDTGRVTVELQAEAVSAYAYLYDADYALAPPPDTTLVDPLALPQPEPPQLTPTTGLADDGSIMPAILVSWTAFAHAFVQWTEVQWRLNGGAWQSAMVAAPASTFTIAPVVVGGTYGVRIRAASHLARGRWSSIESGLGLADTTVPPAPTGVAATGMLRAIQLRWNALPIRDLNRYRVYERVGPAAAWVLVAEPMSTVFIRGGLLPAESREFRVTAVDRSGNEGSPSSIVGASASLLVVADLADGIAKTAMLASGLAPIEFIASLGEERPDNTLALHTGNRLLYKRVAGAWVPMVNTADLVGQISAAQLNALEVFGNEGVFNALRAGIAVFGGLRSTEIKAGEINADHFASTTLITMASQMGTAVIGTAQMQDLSATTAKIGDLSVTELKIAGDAITTWKSQGWSGPSSFSGPEKVVDELFWSPSTRPGILFMEAYAGRVSYYEVTNGIAYGAGVRFTWWVNGAAVYETDGTAINATKTVWINAGNNRIEIIAQPQPYDNTVGAPSIGYGSHGYAPAYYAGFATIARAR